MMLAIEVTAVPEHPIPTSTETMKVGLTNVHVDEILDDKLSERLQLSLREGVAEMIRSVVREAAIAEEEIRGR